MIHPYFHGFLDLSTRDIAVLAGSASLCGAVTSMLGQIIYPQLGEAPALLIAGFFGMLAGNWLLYRLRRKDRDD